MKPRTNLLRRAAAAATAAGVAVSGAVVLSAAPAQALKRVETPFAYQGSAFGTRVTLGDPSAGGFASGRTAWSVLGCTALAPLKNQQGSQVAKVNDNSMIEVGAVDSFTSTYRQPKRETFGSRSVNRVANIVLGSAEGPRLTFRALTTTADAFNVRGRFRARADIDLAGVDLLGDITGDSQTPGPLQDLVDAVDQADDQLVEAIIEGAGTNGIDIPGLGTVYPAGESRTRATRRAANASAYGIRVVLENGSTVTIGRAWARVQGAHPAGVFGGHAYALQASAADGLLGIGRTPYRNLPCTGTDGKWLVNSLSDVQLGGGQATAGVLTAETFGKPFRDGRAVARARAKAADVNLGGQLKIEGVVGQVNVFQNRRGKVVRRNLNGTSVGALYVDQNGDGQFTADERQAAPPPGESLTIDGVAVVEAAVRKNLGKRGLRVHALQVRLLDTGVVVNIGTAKARIAR